MPRLRQWFVPVFIAIFFSFGCRSKPLRIIRPENDQCYEVPPKNDRLSSQPPEYPSLAKDINPNRKENEMGNMAPPAGGGGMTGPGAVGGAGMNGMGNPGMGPGRY